MKYLQWLTAKKHVWSHPSRGAWIEIFKYCRFMGSNRSHPSRGAWIEMSIM